MPSAVNFHSSGLRQSVDQLMDVLWAGGVNNPMDAIEQISYLLFLRLISEQDDLIADLDRKYRRSFSGEWAKYAWGNFVTLTGDPLFDAARPAVENIHKLPGLSATGKLLFERATLKIYDRPTLRAVVQLIDQLDLEAHPGVDLKGEMYEYLLSKLAASGTNGQFRTPRHVINLIVELVGPKPNRRVCDPAVGTAGFLVAAYRHVLREHTAKPALARDEVDGQLLSAAQWAFLREKGFTGYDNDANMVKIAILNLYLHGLERADVELHNPLTTGKGGYPGAKFDFILANPPFAGKVQGDAILTDLNHGLNTRSTELLFLKWFLDHLAPGGRAGVIVPNGVLFGSTKAAKKARELLLDDFDLQAVIGLPSGVFKPYSGVGTAALVFENGGPTRSVWFYDLTADGFSLDDKRTPTGLDDIPDVLAKWPGRVEGPNSYRVPIERIRANDLSLAPGRYKPVAVETATHDAPAQILAEVVELEERIAKGAKKLLAEVGR